MATEIAASPSGSSQSGSSRGVTIAHVSQHIAGATGVRISLDNLAYSSQRSRTYSTALYDHDEAEFAYGGEKRFQTHRMTMGQIYGPIPEASPSESPTRMLRRMSSAKALGVRGMTVDTISGTPVGQTSLHDMGDVLRMKKEWEKAHADISKEERWLKSGRERGYLKEDRFYSPKSLLCLTLGNPLRLAAIKLVESGPFEKSILIVILVNMLFLLLDTPLEPHPFFETAELVFSVIFAVEAVFKIIAFGFWAGKHTYLRNPWNVLDFIIVLTGLLPFISSGLGNYTGVRAFRVLRPVRALTHLQGLKIMVTALLQSLPMLVDVGALTLMFFVVFGILSIQLFAGVMHTRCYVTPTNATEWQSLQPVSERLCGNDTTSHICPTGQICLLRQDMPNILNYGVTNFDNFGVVLLALFQSLTLEGWSEIMYHLTDAVGWPAIVFFVVLVMFGSFFLINLALAVIADNFSSLSQAFVKKTGEKEKTKRWYHLITKPVWDFFKIVGSKIGQFRLPAPVIAFFRVISLSSYFSKLAVSAILINVVALGMEYQNPANPMSGSYDAILSTANLVFTIFFTAEMLVKMIGLGITGYWKDSFNRFDFVVVAVSIIELFLSSGSTFSALRAFRVLRILKLVRSWKGLRRLVNVIYTSFTALAWFVLILLLFLLIYTVLGMQMFGGHMSFDDGTPRTNFDDAYSAFLTVFITLTGENWNSILYEGIRAVGGLAVLYFVSLVIVGNFILFNLFLAILLENFAESQRLIWEKIKVKKKDKKKKRKGGFVRSFIQSRRDSLARSSSPNRSTTIAAVSREESIEMADIKPKLTKTATDTNLMSMAADGFASPISSTTSPTMMSSDDLLDTTPSVTSVPLDSLDESIEIESVAPTKKLTAKKEMEGKSCLILTQSNPIRKLCWKIATHVSFEWIMLFFILTSTVCLAFEGPHADKDKELKFVLFILDVVFVVVFTVEMVVKMVSFGVFRNKTAYFRDGWNYLDFVIVVVGWISMFYADSAIKSVRVLRTFRALRPLRLLSKSGGMRAVINTLIQAMPSIANAMIVCLTFWIIFAIIGVQMLGGRFYSCNDATKTTIQDCIGQFNATLSDGTVKTLSRAWETPMMNFDNFGTSLLLLFQIVSLEGWPDVMYQGMDVTDVGKAPSPNASPFFGLFFIAFVIFGSFFMVNIFIGVVIDTFSRIQGETSGESLMTKAQSDWVRTQKEMVRAKPIRYYEEPNNPVRLVAFFVAFHRYFERTIIGVIILNAVQMAIDHFPMDSAFRSALELANYVFTAIYISEMVIKLLGMGIKHYFQDPWNRLDFVVVVTSIVDIFFPDAVGFVKVLRIMRIARIFKLIRSAAGVRTLLQTLYFSLPSLANVGLLLFIFFFIYAVMGVSLFGHVKLNGSLDDYANFQTFGNAMSVLFRVSTGEDWQAVMEGVRVSPPICTPDVVFEDCGSDWSILYFISFILVVGFVLLNLFIAIILEQFSTTQEEEGQDVKPMDIKLFSEKWARYDHNASATIHLDLLIPLLRELGPPLGLTGQSSEHTRIRMLRSLDIPVQPDGEIHFMHTLRGLIKRGAAMNDGTHQLSHEQEIGVLKDLEKQLRKVLPEVKESDFNVAEWAAAKLLQRSWRATHLLRREKRIESMRMGVGKRRIKPFLPRD